MVAIFIWKGGDQRFGNDDGTYTVYICFRN